MTRHSSFVMRPLLSPVVKYRGLGHRDLLPRDFLMRPQLNGGTLGGRASSP